MLDLLQMPRLSVSLMVAQCLCLGGHRLTSLELLHVQRHCFAFSRNKGEGRKQFKQANTNDSIKTTALRALSARII